MSDKLDIWLTLARDKYPTPTEDQLKGLSLHAANDWLFGVESDLTKLYDQYVMIKTLKDL